MRTLSVPSSALRLSTRLDSWYFTSPANLAVELLAAARKSGVTFERLGGTSGLASIWTPNRFKRVYAVEGEDKVPYLRPYDVFAYLPQPADHLSVKRTAKLDDYELAKGMILQTCSGRNLGPAVAVDAYLSRFVLSHDMIRIEIADERMRSYVLAYLKSNVGQALLRRSKTGSVIDHLSVEHLTGQEIPIFDKAVVDQIAKQMSAAVNMREAARAELDSLISEFEAGLPRVARKQPRKFGWTTRSSALKGRLDAAFYDPVVQQMKKTLLARGGTAVRELAQVKMLGRYKRLYTSPPLGRPIISGAQLLQSKPINAQHILPQSFDDVTEFELVPGTIAYPSDGRSEESLGTPVLVTDDRKGWLASNMVGRLIPRKGVDVGSLYLALRSPMAQAQFKATASGSVVDHTYPEDMESVILPPLENIDGRKVRAAWKKLSDAQVTEDAAVSAMQVAIEKAGGGRLT